MFKVKLTIVDFLGEVEKYPCHFEYKIGDEIVFDGEKCIGRVCPHVWTVIIPKVAALQAAGPRYIDPEYYHPFWYSPFSTKDLSMKKYDGLGFKPLKQSADDPPYNLAALLPKGAFEYPPLEERAVLKDIMAICPDVRTSVLFKFEADDLTEVGDEIPYYRKQMVTLDTVRKNPGIEVNRIREELPQEQKEDVYPPATRVMMRVLIEELELVDFLRIENGKAEITKKGGKKLDAFKASLTDDERVALRL